MSDRFSLGKYTAVRGKLSSEDSRSAYVLGPASDGQIRPLASFWFYEDAVHYVKERNKEEKNEGK